MDDDDNANALTAEQQAEFKRLADSIGTQIFKINSNVAAVEKLVGLAGGHKARQAAAASSSSSSSSPSTDWTRRA